MNTLRALSTYVVPVALLLALAGCGSNGAGGGPPGGGESGPEVLFGAPAEALLNTFVDATVNPSTGGFSSVSILVVPYLGSGGIAAVGAQFLYVSLPNGQLFGYSIDQTTGTLTSLAGSPFSLGPGASPQGLAAAPNGHFLYVADASRIDAFSVDSVTGALTPITGSPFTSGTNQQLVADPSGKFLYASDDDPPGGILAFTIGPTGALTAVPGSPFTIPGQTSANSQPVGIVDTGSFVYAGLTADDEIAAFSIDGGTGALARVPGSPFSAGSFPNVLALANSFLYAANWQDSSISAYSIDPGSGVLAPVPGSSFATSGVEIVGEPSGKYLYVSTGVGLGDYNIDPATGALSPGVTSLSNEGGLWLTVVQLPSPAAQ